MSRGSQTSLSRLFLSEAYLEFPDEDIAPVGRVIASAARNGRIPRNAAEDWEIRKGPVPKASVPAPAKAAPAPANRPKPKEPTGKASVGPAASPPAPSSRTGRVIPATNRFRQPDAGGPDEPPASAPGKKRQKPTVRSGPGAVSRAAAALRGRDPESGLPRPRSAVSKAHGGHGPATSLPRLDRMFGSGEGDEFPDERTDPEYVSPFAHIPGLSGNDDDDSESDPKVAAVRKGFAAARPKAGGKPNVGFPEADVWDRFGGGPEPDDDSKSKKRGQGRLSRFFKGRRDDDI